MFGNIREITSGELPKNDDAISTIVSALTKLPYDTTPEKTDQLIDDNKQKQINNAQNPTPALPNHQPP